MIRGRFFVRRLQEIAALKLQNIQGVSRDTQDKLELAEIAFGKNQVLADFELWCDENAHRDTEYPLTEYCAAIDARLRVKREPQPQPLPEADGVFRYEIS